jgi:peptidoglycan/LPS O-acetylase OafA/YrhL
VPHDPSPRWVALDGLRAIAVLLVVGFHAGGLIGHGSLGIDVFFVLSGFLITTLLAAEHTRTGRVDLLGFYRRRVLRLAPALVTVCVFVVLLAVVTGRQFAAISAGALASMLYVANLWQYSGHDTPLLEHTWTLALESQFYLFWPLLLPLVLRHRAAGYVLLAACSAVGLLGTMPGTGPVLHTYIRAVGLPLGCALALALRGGAQRRWRQVLAPLGAPALLAIMVLAGLPAGHADAFGGLPGVAALLSVPVVVTLTQPGWLTALLARPAPVWLGERSYGLYLWHFPVLSLLINHAPAAIPMPARLVVGVVLSVLVSAASYRWVEQPFLRRAHSPR